MRFAIALEDSNVIRLTRSNKWPPAASNLEKMKSPYQHHYARKIHFYRALYDFTFNQCGYCIESGCACKDRICQHVEEQAALKGVKLERTNHALRFIGERGCVVAPHLRETCTIYLCGKAQDKKGFNQSRYEKLKRICSKIDWRLMELEEASTLAATSTPPSAS